VYEGRITRFDQADGYGFVSYPDSDDDLFIHVNDFSGDRKLLRDGALVEFEVVEGDRGLHAVDISVVGSSEGSLFGFQLEVTEALIRAAPTITAEQLDQVRVAIMEIATAHGWVS